MAVQKAPHTQTHQNFDDALADLEPNLLRQDVGQGEDVRLYANADGVQTGGTRSFHANDQRSHLPEVEGEVSALDGGTDTRLIQSDEQGVTTHSASEESARQAKVVSERPGTQQGVDQVGKAVRPTE